MDKESQREYRRPSQPDNSDNSSRPNSPGRLHGFVAGLWNGWTGANLTPDEYSANWLHMTNAPPTLRQKLQRYYQRGHGVNRSMLYRLMNKLNRGRK